MADKEEGEETTPRGADWEVVSLTASTYAAAPGPNVEDPKHDDKNEVEKTESSNPLFMSGHFVFPPNQHENLPLESEKNPEILGEDTLSESIKEDGEKSYDSKDDDNWNIKKLTESDEFDKIPFLDEKRADIDTTLKGLDLEKFESFHGEPIMGESNLHDDDDDDEDRVLVESLESSDDSDVQNVSKHIGDDVPYGAWWKKQAASLYSHAKEANTFWSIFIAAAVMGLVIIGQQWQQERWQVLHHKWHSGVYDEKFGRMLGPLSRFKEAIVGGNRRGFSIRGSSSTRDH